MNLLCFAHRAEADCFFIEENLKADARLNDLYREDSDKYFVLITGEGHLNALYKVTSAISIEPRIKNVINLGVSGALNNDLKKFDVFSIRTSYFCEASEHNPQFKSFPINSINNLKSIDCITSTQRIKTENEKYHLKNFADTVDRELWGIGYAAKGKKIPVYSVKVISDEVKDLDFCQNVKESSYDYSIILYKTFNKYFNQNDSIEQNSLFEGLIKNPLFYFSTSQKRLLKKLILDSKINQDQLDQICLGFSQIENNKNNSKKFLLKLEQYISPELFEVNQIVNKLFKNLEASKINVTFDKNFEDQTLKLTTQIKNQKELQNRIRALENFSLNQWENFINGDF